VVLILLGASCLLVADFSGYALGATLHLARPIATKKSDTPAVRLLFPANGGSYDTSNWNGGCSRGAGLCGRANAPMGVSSVAIAVRDGSGRWWGGHGFTKRHKFFITAQGTSHWSYPFGLPVLSGRYTVQVRAVSNRSGGAVATGPRHSLSGTAAVFTIRSPASPVIPTHPSNIASPTPAGCGGEAVPPKPGGGQWTCAFDDEFDASTGDASSMNTSWWTPQVSATSGYVTGPAADVACYENSPNNISVSGGALHLTARKEAAPFMCGSFPTQYTSGMVSSIYGFSQTYGRYEVRAQLPQATAAGLQETLWLWPENDTQYGAWPGSGEVDFSEFYSEYSSLDIPDIHYNSSPSTVDSLTHTNVTTAYCPISLSGYNDYAVVWSPGSFSITINGHTCLVDNYLPDAGLSSPEPFNEPFFIALTQALGIGTNAFNPSTTPLPATTSIDYVRVWK
jgi:beta-glucanase (GH16 family)